MFEEQHRSLVVFESTQRPDAILDGDCTFKRGLSPTCYYTNVFSKHCLLSVYLWSEAWAFVLLVTVVGVNHSDIVLCMVGFLFDSVHLAQLFEVSGRFDFSRVCSKRFRIPLCVCMSYVFMMLECSPTAPVLISLALDPYDNNSINIWQLQQLINKIE